MFFKNKHIFKDSKSCKKYYIIILKECSIFRAQIKYRAQNERISSRYKSIEPNRTEQAIACSLGMLGFFRARAMLAQR